MPSKNVVLQVFGVGAEAWRKSLSQADLAEIEAAKAEAASEAERNRALFKSFERASEVSDEDARALVVHRIGGLQTDALNQSEKPTPTWRNTQPKPPGPFAVPKARKSFDALSPSEQKKILEIL